jgi:ribosomal-protein-alanine N-acetyltransferase
MASGLNWQGSVVLNDATRLEVDLFTEADLDAVCRTELQAHAYPWKRPHFADSLKASHQYCLGVRTGSRWVAHAVVSCVAGEAELLLLVVDSAWQGRGVGRQLLSHIVQCLQNAADTIFLEVGATNSRAIGLYELLDFNQVGFRPDYYRRGSHSEDALIFARTLD